MMGRGMRRRKVAVIDDLQGADASATDEKVHLYSMIERVVG